MEPCSNPAPVMLAEMSPTLDLALPKPVAGSSKTTMTLIAIQVRVDATTVVPFIVTVSSCCTNPGPTPMTRIFLAPVPPTPSLAELDLYSMPTGAAGRFQAICGCHILTLVMPLPALEMAPKEETADCPPICPVAAARACSKGAVARDIGRAVARSCASVTPLGSAPVPRGLVTTVMGTHLNSPEWQRQLPRCRLKRRR